MTSEDQERIARQRRLRAHIDQRHGGNVSAYARAVKRSQTQIADMLSDPPRKSFGEKVAKALAEAEELPSDYFLRDAPIHVVPPPPYWPFSVTPDQIKQLSPPEREKLDGMVTGFVEGAEAARQRSKGKAHG